MAARAPAGRAVERGARDDPAAVWRGNRRVPAGGRHPGRRHARNQGVPDPEDRKSTRLNSSHRQISYTGFCFKKSVFVALPILGKTLLTYWPRTRMGRRMLLMARDEDDTMASLPANQDLEQLRGRFGRAVSPL